ncbi:ferredoxin:thioredoxin reductase [Candidatus Parcubacteria bacterium]|nr:ferredoxin:thioredoxin reductase [Candidatus Parcubacteria bacterium]
MQDNVVEKIIEEYKKYAEENGFKLNPNKEVAESLVKGLIAREKKYGARYCPCRRVTGNKEKDKLKICPCPQHKKEIKQMGHCYCNLFVK